MLPGWLRLETDLKALSHFSRGWGSAISMSLPRVSIAPLPSQLQSGNEIGEIARQYQPGENKRKIPRAVAFKFARWWAIAL